MFSDCKNAQSQLVNVEYNHKSLINITKEYINQTCEKENCISYERDIQLTKTSFGIFSGIHLTQAIYSESEIKSNLTTSIPFGIFWEIPLNRISDRFSFQVELLPRYIDYKHGFSGLSGDLENISISSWVFGLPLYLRYKLSRRKVAPVIGIGKEFGFVISSDVQYTYEHTHSDGSITIENTNELLHRTQKGGWFFEFGMNYEINRKLSIFSNIRIQRYYNLIIDEKNANRLSFNKVENDNLGVKYLTNMTALHVGVRF